LSARASKSSNVGQAVQPGKERQAGKPAPQKIRRPNRAHGAVDRLPQEIQLLIKDWYLGDIERKIPRLTLDQMVTALAALDPPYTISRNQLWKWLARKRNEIERLDDVRQRASALVKHLVPQGADIESAVVSLLNGLALEALADADLMQVKSIGDLSSVAHAVGRLQTSQVAREKWEHERHKKSAEALAELKAEAQEILRGRPELLKQLLDVLEVAEEKILEKTA